MNDPWTPDEGPIVSGDSLPQNSDYHSIALEKLQMPSLFLIIAGALSILMGLLNGVLVAVDPGGNPFMPEGSGNDAAKIVGSVFGAVICIALSAFVVFGAVKMRQAQSYGVCMAAAVVALIPCVGNCICCVFNIPLAIWAIVILCNADVKRGFAN